MNKRALMLTAATAALMSGPAFGQCDYTTEISQPVDTKSCAGTITITTSGSVVVTTNPYTTPAVTIDGNGSGGAADVINQGTIKYDGVGSSTTPMTGIEMVAGNTGGLDNAGTLDFTGSGSNKTGILFNAGGLNASDRFIGDITQTSGGQTLSDLFSAQSSWKFDAPNPAAVLLESGSNFKIAGDTSIGIDIASGANLGTALNHTDIDIIGPMSLLPSSSSSSSSDSMGIQISGTMTGDINILPGGSITVTGDGSSNGIFIQPPNPSSSQPGGVMNGDINIDGNLTVNPVNTKSLTSTGDSAILMGGTLNGNINIGTSGVVSAIGEGSEALVMTGTLNGYIDNQGSLEAVGTTSPAISNNPQSGSALLITGNVTGGIFNDGPIGGNTQQNGVITALGGVPAINISPASDATGGLTIGGYSDNGDLASLLNRGEIISGSENPDTSAVGVEIGGSSAYTVTLTDGILNSGSISASASTDTKGGTGTTAVGLLVAGYADIGVQGGAAGIFNTNENTNSPGRISATVSGEAGGEAIAIEIDQNGDVPSLINQGTIVAEASTTNPTLTGGAVHAIAIIDSSGTLASITNESNAYIEAFASTLDDNSQIATAIDVSANTNVFNLNNQGTIIGGLNLASGTDNVVVSGLSPDAQAVIDGTIYFDGYNTAVGPDNLTIGQNGRVTGILYSGSTNTTTGGLVDVTVQNGGSLDMLTAATLTTLTSNPGLTEGITFDAYNFNVDSVSSLNLHYSQNFNTDNFQNAVIVNAQNSVTLQNGATVTFTPDSFITPPLGFSNATFVLFKSPTLNVSSTEITSMNTTFLQDLSYLFNPTPFTGNTCPTGNVSGSGICENSAANELELIVTPKTVGGDGCKTQTEVGGCNLAHIPLYGYAATMFPYVNIALGNDNQLGAAVINSVTNSYNAEQTYQDFAPDVSGAIRADAISLTDDATNVVAARQRVLRQYANQDGDLTLWGQQFVQRLNQDNTSAGPGFEDTGWGFVFGGDEGDPVDGRYGAAFTFYSGDTREKAPRDTSTHSEWYLATGYTDWRGKGLFLDTQLNLGYTSLSTNRYVILDEFPIANPTTFSRDAYAQHPGELASLGATTGATFDENGTVFTPQLSLDGLVMRQEPYNESGGGPGFDLHVNSNYAQSFRAFTGLGIRQDLDFTDFLVQPDILAGYRYDFANGADNIKGNFESVSPPEIFSITGPKPDAGNIVASGGLSISTGAWSLGVNFDYLRASSGNTSEEGSLTLLGRI